jgi:hypothetical protein
MKAAIMQPYFLPYVGYFQLIAAVDLFIVYHNIQYTKSGWINRNRPCRNGEMVTFSLPLKSASDHLDVRERELAANFKREKLLNKIKEAYRPAGQLAAVFPVIERIVGFEDGNLFRFLRHSIACICDFLEISTEIRISSSIDIDHEHKGVGQGARPVPGGGCRPLCECDRRNGSLLQGRVSRRGHRVAIHALEALRIPTVRPCLPAVAFHFGRYDVQPGRQRPCLRRAQLRAGLN